MNKLLSVSILFLLGINSALAANITGNFQTTSTLMSACTIQADDLNFGNVNLINGSATYNATGNIKLLCNKGVVFAIRPTLDDVNGYQKLVGTAGNSDQIKYVLYREAAYNYIKSAWRTVAPISTTSDGTLMTLPISAQIDSGQNQTVKPDNYSGTITATVTY